MLIQSTGMIRPLVGEQWLSALATVCPLETRFTGPAQREDRSSTTGNLSSEALPMRVMQAAVARAAAAETWLNGCSRQCLFGIASMSGGQLANVCVCMLVQWYRVDFSLALCRLSSYNTVSHPCVWCTQPSACLTVRPTLDRAAYISMHRFAKLAPACADADTCQCARLCHSDSDPAAKAVRRLPLPTTCQGHRAVLRSQSLCEREAIESGLGARPARSRLRMHNSTTAALAGAPCAQRSEPPTRPPPVALCNSQQAIVQQHYAFHQASSCQYYGGCEGHEDTGASNDPRRAVRRCLSSAYAGDRTFASAKPAREAHIR